MFFTKRKLLKSILILITITSFKVNAQITQIPDQWMKDSMPALVQKA